MNHFHSRLRTICICILLMVAAGCTNYDFSNRVIKQGNLNIARNADKLKVGMSKNQVAKIMGTSLVSPMFRMNRWDYVNMVKKPNQASKIQSVSIFFEHDSLSRVVKH